MVDFSGGSIAVVAAHPDDEVLGCGGTVAREAARGRRVRTLIVGEGLTSRSSEPGSSDWKADLEQLEKTARVANSRLGVEDVKFGRLPDNRMDSRPLLEVIKLVEQFIGETDPSVVFTHHRGDLNVDHAVVNQAVLTACRPQPGIRVEAIYAFETLSSTEWQAQPGTVFHPSDYFDISETLTQKMEALSLYESEIREWPHPRSKEGVLHSARFRGSQVGMDAAEAMICLRRIHW